MKCFMSVQAQSHTSFIFSSISFSLASCSPDKPSERIDGYLRITFLVLFQVYSILQKKTMLLNNVLQFLFTNQRRIVKQIMNYVVKNDNFFKKLQLIKDNTVGVDISPYQNTKCVKLFIIFIKIHNFYCTITLQVCRQSI